MVPLSCLLSNTPDDGPLSSGADTEQSSAGRSTFLSLPSETLVVVLHNLTLTSRVNLSLTCKRLATTLSNTARILIFDRLSLTTQEREAFISDGSFKCWSLSPGNFFLRPPRLGMETTRLRMAQPRKCTLTCNSCVPDKSINCPHRPIDPNLLVMVGPERYEAVYEEQFKKANQGFRAYSYRHIKYHVCANSDGSFFTKGMFKLFDIYVAELRRQQNLKWARWLWSVGSWHGVRG